MEYVLKPLVDDDDKKADNSFELSALVEVRLNLSMELISDWLKIVESLKWIK